MPGKIMITPPVDPSSILDPNDLLEIARRPMPFGHYKGVTLIDLPEPYVVWFAKQGFPEGRLGHLLGLLYEIKANGLEYLFDRLRATPSF